MVKDLHAIGSPTTIEAVPGVMFNFTDLAIQYQSLRQAILHAIGGTQINNAVAPHGEPVDAFLGSGNFARDDALGTYPTRLSPKPNLSSATSDEEPAIPSP